MQTLEELQCVIVINQREKAQEKVNVFVVTLSYCVFLCFVMKAIVAHYNNIM